MNRPIVQSYKNIEGNDVNFSFPEVNKWSIRQHQVLFFLENNFKKNRINQNYYIAYHYGECSGVIDFAEFFSAFWRDIGKFVYEEDEEAFNVIDEKFIEWVEIMEFEKHSELLALDFDKAFKRFMLLNTSKN